MWRNFLVSGSNLIGVIGIFNYYTKGEYLNFIAILFSVTSSIIYHLIEKNKHNMPGIGYFKSNYWQKKLLNLDRLGAVFAALITMKRIISLWGFINLNKLIVIGIIGIMGEIIPEIISGLYNSGRHDSIIPNFIVILLNPNKNKININLEHKIYIIGHCIWHISVFSISNIISYL